MKFLLCTLLGLSVFLILQLVGFHNVNGILVGDGREESDLILVGKVISFTENKTALDTDYVVQVEEYLKFPKNYDTTKHVITITSPGLRQYDDPSREVIYGKLFNVGDRVLFLLYLDDGKLSESLWSLTTTSSCTPKQLLQEMSGPSGLSISQNNQARYLYTNRPVDLTFYVYNMDLKSQTKDFEFKVISSEGKISEKRQVQLEECKRSTKVSWSFVPTVSGKYAFLATIGNGEGGSEAFSGISIIDYVEPPLKQSKSGIIAENVVCKEGLELIMKAKDHSPSCVKPETKSKLIKRGWALDPDSPLINLGPTDTDENPYAADKEGKVDLSKIRLPPTEYGLVDYEKIGYLVSENQFKKILEEKNIEYHPDNSVFIQGISATSDPPYTDYCGYVQANNKEDYWFSSSYHYDTLTSANLYDENPMPCEPNHEECFCFLQTRLAEKNLETLSYYTSSEEEMVGNTVSKYLNHTPVSNVPNKFVVGKYNLDSESADIHYCGKFGSESSHTYFVGYIKNSNVIQFGLEFEKPKLCAINDNPLIFQR